jgi:hypothetical protein
VGHPVKGFLIWVLASILLLIAGVLIVGPEHNVISSEPLTNTLIVPAVAILCISLICTLSAFVMSIPNEEARKFSMLPIFVLIVWFGVMTYLFASADLHDSRPGILCVLRIIGLSAAPGALLFYMLRKAAPMRAGLIGLFAAVGALGFGELGVQFLCHKSLLETHVIVWHLVPVSVLALVGVVIGRTTFR